MMYIHDGFEPYCSPNGRELKSPTADFIQRYVFGI
jgi:hypothetical protein